MVVSSSGELKLVFESGAFEVHYYENHFPIDPRTYGLIIASASEQLIAKLGIEDPAALELASIVNQTRHIPPRMEANGERLGTERISEGRVECASIRRRASRVGPPATRRPTGSRRRSGGYRCR